MKFLKVMAGSFVIALCIVVLMVVLQSRIAHDIQEQDGIEVTCYLCVLNEALGRADTEGGYMAQPLSDDLEGTLKFGAAHVETLIDQYITTLADPDGQAERDTIIESFAEDDAYTETLMIRLLQERGYLVK